MIYNEFIEEKRLLSDILKKKEKTRLLITKEFVTV